MTFKTKDLNILAHAGKFVLWHLKAPEGAEAPGYLDRASGMVNPGDVIFAQQGPVTSILTVTENKGGKVTVEAMPSTGNLLPDAKPAPQPPSPPEPAKVLADTPPKPATKKGK